jgi:hypothetical protein
MGPVQRKQRLGLGHVELVWPMVKHLEQVLSLGSGFFSEDHCSKEMPDGGWMR